MRTTKNGTELFNIILQTCKLLANQNIWSNSLRCFCFRKHPLQRWLFNSWQSFFLSFILWSENKSNKTLGETCIVESYSKCILLVITRMFSKTTCIYIYILFENIDQILPNKLHRLMHYKIGVKCVYNRHVFYTLLW